MTKRKFGELELAILHILKSNPGMTVKSVLQLLGNENKYTTIMTVMNRLCEKNQLQREKVGSHYEYHLCAPEIPSLIGEWKKKIFGIKTSEMISYLIQTSDDISDDDLDEIEKMIKESKQKKS